MADALHEQMNSDLFLMLIVSKTMNFLEHEFAVEQLHDMGGPTVIDLVVMLKNDPDVKALLGVT